MFFFYFSKVDNHAAALGLDPVGRQLWHQLFGALRHVMSPFEEDLEQSQNKCPVLFFNNRTQEGGGEVLCAQGFRQGRKVEPQVRATLAAMARMGFIAVHDGGTRFALRRAA